jgi:hypothetical protein
VPEPLRQVAMVLVILKPHIDQLTTLSNKTSLSTIFQPAKTKATRQSIVEVEKDYLVAVELLKCPQTLKEALTYTLPQENVAPRLGGILCRLIATLRNATQTRRQELNVISISDESTEIWAANCDALQIIYQKIAALAHPEKEIAPPRQRANAAAPSQ